MTDSLLPLKPPPRVPPKPKSPSESSVNTADLEKLSDINLLSESVKKIEVTGIGGHAQLQPAEEPVVCTETHHPKQTATDVASTGSVSALDDQNKSNQNCQSIPASHSPSTPEALLGTLSSADFSANALFSKKEHKEETADIGDTPKMYPIPKPRTLLPSKTVKTEETKQDDKILSPTKNNCSSECNSSLPAVPPRRKKSAPAAFHLQVLQSNQGLLQFDMSSNNNNNNNHNEGCLIDLDTDIPAAVSTKGDSDHLASHTKPLEPQRSWSSKELDLLDFDKNLDQFSSDASFEQFTDNWLMGQEGEKSENTVLKNNCESPW
ncbi:uncharacterized protein [Pyxicephalus adspersus]|uniref:uncharacterized protein n=1 Tax=Pyxicephalus adspersus TaxID=30357 RepID=UPI003B5ADF6C